MIKNNQIPENSELGKKSESDFSYNPDRLFPIPRAEKRIEIGVDPGNLPFHGFDIWNHYEVSWLNAKGKPIVAMATIIYDCRSSHIIESKSMKLYFNSFNNHKFDSIAEVVKTIKNDVSKKINFEVQVDVRGVSEFKSDILQTEFDGICIDDLDTECDKYLVEPSFLRSGQKIVEEVLHSNLLKSNCLVTNQPDWGSVKIAYKGPQIDRVGLLKYIVSLRNHNEFHEQCVERIFADILKMCKPLDLTVYARYTRRGGLDINPFRSTKEHDCTGLNQRLIRQ